MALIDEQAAADFENGMSEIMDTIIRRIGGSSDRTEPVQASVAFDQSDIGKVARDSGGLVDSERGKFTVERGLVEVSANQATLPTDTWVIDGKVYNAVGEPPGRDGGSKTIEISRRVPIVARHGRVNRR